MEGKNSNPYGVSDDILSVAFNKHVLNNNKITDSQKVAIYAKEVYRLMRKVNIGKIVKINKKLRKEKLKLNGWTQILKNKDELYALALTPAEYFYKNKIWKSFRFYVFSKLEKQCISCNSTENLHVDHILPRSVYPEKAFELSNMQILCKECNLGKGVGPNYRNHNKVILRKNNNSNL